MHMKVAAFYISFFLLYFSFLHTPEALSQVGLPYLSNYKVPSQLGNQMWGIVQGDSQEMYFLNRKGVFAFDGYGWEALPLKERPFALCNKGKLYVSTEKGLYSFVRGDNGQFVSTRVSGNNGDYFHKFLTAGDNLYAVGTQNIMKLNQGEKESLVSLYSEKDKSQFVTEAFSLNGALFIVKNKEQLYAVNSGKATSLAAGLPYLVDINFTFGNDKVVFIGLSNNKLFRFDGKIATQVLLKDHSYFDDSYLSDGILIDDEHMALSTKLGGSLVINIRTGETVATINSSAGLPDEEISALGVDGQKGLWLAHGMGVSRIDFQIPLRTISHFSGLSGNVLSVAEFNGLSYVGTSEGLFVLDTKEDYSESIVSVKERIVVTKPAVNPQPSQLQPNETVEKKKKGFFGRMFSNDSQSEVVTAISNAKVEEPEQLSAEKVSKRKILTLQSISHLYNRVDGVAGKCQQLLVLDGKLLAVTSLGVFEVSKGGAKPIVVGKDIRVAAPSVENKSIVWLGGADGIFALQYKNGDWQYNPAISLGNDEPTSIVELSINELLVSTESKVVRLLVGGKGAPLSVPVNGMLFDSPLVRRISGSVRIISKGNVYTYNLEQNNVVRDSLEFSAPITDQIFTQDDVSWLCIDQAWQSYSSKGVVGNHNAQFISLLDKVNAIFVTPSNDLLVVNNFHDVVRIAVPKDYKSVAEIPIVIKKVEDGDGRLLDINSIELTYSNNSLRILLASPSYVKERSTEYQYVIEGMMDEWSEWSSNPNLVFPFFPSGHYTLNIRARDLLGRQSEVYSLDFRIQPPFWKSVWFISICVLAFLVLVFMFIRVRERNLLRDKIMLEQKVRMRTQTIEEQKQELESQRDALSLQNDEIMQQKEEIETQRDEIEAQRDHIFKQSENITKSIEYAKKIQTAAMPSTEAVNEVLPEHFILFRPRDIVSGDFFWTTSYHGKVILAAADCTGHGVPGAFMSMLGLSFLNEVVVKIDDLHPGSILNKLRAFIKSTLSQRGNEGGSKDGMDIALCIIDYENRTVEFAGAYNPLYYVKDGELLEIKGDKMPVGIHISEKESFTNHVLPLDGITSLYLFSDGFVDQFGGADNSKFKAKNFRALIDQIQSRPMAEQGAMLEKAFDEWKGDYEQVDDVLVMGVRIV